MTAQTILVVEDEPSRQHLEHAGYQTAWLDAGDRVEEWVRVHAPDLVLLDLMLPGKDGIAVCRDLRTFTPLPIIMVTARVDEIDRLLGLELGADDYICKPFSPREVVARVKAVLRRSGPESTHTSEEGGALRYGPIEIDRERFSCQVRGRDVVLTPVEFRLLEALLRSAGKVLSRARLIDVSYEDQRVVSDRTVDSHIKNLRRKLDEAAPDLDPIQSIYGVGYRLK